MHNNHRGVDYDLAARGFSTVDHVISVLCNRGAVYVLSTCTGTDASVGGGGGKSCNRGSCWRNPTSERPNGVTVSRFCYDITVFFRLLCNVILIQLFNKSTRFFLAALFRFGLRVCAILWSATSSRNNSYGAIHQAPDPKDLLLDSQAVREPYVERAQCVT